jgi:hypothetical protein
LELNLLILQDMILTGTGIVDDEKMAEMFVGDHIAYAISECKLVSGVRRQQPLSV